MFTLLLTHATKSKDMELAIHFDFFEIIKEKNLIAAIYTYCREYYPIILHIYIINILI